MGHQVYLGLGSNLGNREELLARAIELIGERVGPVVRRSTLIETEPWGFESEHTFLNGVILCETEKLPREVLQLTQQIERELGRKTKTRHAQQPVSNNPSPMGNAPSSVYTDRPIDIDILLYDDLHVEEPGLIIPHPLMRERDFVMRPLSEIRRQTEIEN